MVSLFTSFNKERHRWTIFYLLIILTSLQLFIALLTNGFALSQEEAMWHYIGRNWFRHGLVPYTGGADNKSPLFYVIFGLSDWLWGVNYWFPRVLGTVVQSTGIFYIYKIARQISDKQAGLIASSFYGLSVLWHGSDGRYVSFTETYEVLCIIFSFYFFLSSKNKEGYIISGLFFDNWCRLPFTCPICYPRIINCIVPKRMEKYNTFLSWADGRYPCSCIVRLSVGD